MSIAAIQAGIKTRLATITGLRVYDYLPDQPQPPMAVVQFNSLDYHGAFGGGMADYNLTVTLVLGRIIERTTVSNLDGYASPSGASSIRAAIEAEQTLGGAAQTATVTTMSNPRAVTYADATFYAVDFEVLVRA